LPWPLPSVNKTDFRTVLTAEIKLNSFYERKKQGKFEALSTVLYNWDSRTWKQVFQDIREENNRGQNCILLVLALYGLGLSLFLKVIDNRFP